MILGEKWIVRVVLFGSKCILEAPGIDPGTSRMLSERSTIWATPPSLECVPRSVYQSYKQARLSRVGDGSLGGNSGSMACGKQGTPIAFNAAGRGRGCGTARPGLAWGWAQTGTSTSDWDHASWTRPTKICIVVKHSVHPMSCRPHDIACTEPKQPSHTSLCGPVPVVMNAHLQTVTKWFMDACVVSEVQQAKS